MEAILRGEVQHAFHPGGGLHHAMPAAPSGFCVYDDPALAIARARRDGLRVLYIDLDVHHGDGVQAIHWADPGVLTVSIHETGMALFPGTGFPDELGGSAAPGRRSTSRSIPGRASAAGSRRSSSSCRRSPSAFRPEVIVSQHGADAHAFDPLAHLHGHDDRDGRRRAAGRLAGPSARRRPLARRPAGAATTSTASCRAMWAHVWLAQTHAAVPGEICRTPGASAGRTMPSNYGQSPIPTTFDDPPNAGLPYDRPGAGRRPAGRRDRGGRPAAASWSSLPAERLRRGANRVEHPFEIDARRVEFRTRDRDHQLSPATSAARGAATVSPVPGRRSARAVLARRARLVRVGVRDARRPPRSAAGRRSRPAVTR